MSQYADIATKRAINHFHEPGCAESFGDLTSREQEVALLVAKGFTNKVIADRLFISRWTVKHHVSAIMDKVGVPMYGSGYDTRVLLARWLWTQER